MPLTLYKVRIYFRLESTEFGRCFKTWERQTEKREEKEIMEGGQTNLALEALLGNGH